MQPALLVRRSWHPYEMTWRCNFSRVAPRQTRLIVASLPERSRVAPRHHALRKLGKNLDCSGQCLHTCGAEAGCGGCRYLLRGILNEGATTSLRPTTGMTNTLNTIRASAAALLDIETHTLYHQPYTSSLWHLSNTIQTHPNTIRHHAFHC